MLANGDRVRACEAEHPDLFRAIRGGGGNVVTVVPYYSGDLDQGERLLRPLRNFGPPAADRLQRKRYIAHQAMFDGMVPHQ